MQADLLLNYEDSSFVPFISLLKEEIKANLGEAVFYAWFKDISFYSYDGITLLLSVKNEKIKNCIFLHYQSKFEKTLNRSFRLHFHQKLKSYDVIVQEEQQQIESKQDITFDELAIKTSDSIRSNLFNIGIDVDSKFTFANLLETEENKLQIGVAKHISSSIIAGDKSSTFAFSKQFFISGAIGNGKTHLAQAILNDVKQHPKHKVLYTTAERFLFNFQTAVKLNETVAFMKEFIGIKLLVIDDIHFIASKKKTLEELTRVCYSVLSENGYVIFASSGIPQSLTIENPKVKNFLTSSYVIKIPEPTEDFRYNVLKFKLSLSKYNVSENMLKLLAAKISTNIRELEGAMARMVLHSQILNYEIEQEAVDFIKTDILSHKQLKKFTSGDIKKEVCKHFGISVSDLESKKRSKVIVSARQIAIYLCTKLSVESYVEIGKTFNRTHSTVIHSIKKIEHYIQSSKTVKTELDILKIKIEESLS